MAKQEYGSDDGYDDQSKNDSTFIANARAMCRKHGGACVFEFFHCAHCNEEHFGTHPFCERLICPNCKKPSRSRVPRLPQPGEVTNDMLIEAIRCVRIATPVVNEATAEWLKKQEGAVIAVANAHTCVEIHRVLNHIEDIARHFSGGHRA